MDEEELKEQLEAMQDEHRQLDRQIQELSAASPFNQLQVQRLKKRKLQLKDEISKLESELYPDIIA